MNRQDLICKAIDLIDNFCNAEYDHDAEWSDIDNIPIAYTTDENGNEIQVSVDLKNVAMIYEHEGKETYIDEFKDLDELIHTELVFLNFNDLVSVY